MEVIILALVMDTYVYTWFPGSRTKLGHFRMCVYREYRPVIDEDQRYTWYLHPYLNTYCDPYVVYQAPLE